MGTPGCSTFQHPAGYDIVMPAEPGELRPAARATLLTYATADLHRYLAEVVSYVSELKRELQQEAMALEVDNQLMLL
jgi:hypothetical protein